MLSGIYEMNLSNNEYCMMQYGIYLMDISIGNQKTLTSGVCALILYKTCIKHGFYQVLRIHFFCISQYEEANFMNESKSLS